MEGDLASETLPALHVNTSFENLFPRCINAGADPDKGWEGIGQNLSGVQKKPFSARGGYELTSPLTSKRKVSWNIKDFWLFPDLFRFLH